MPVLSPLRMESRRCDSKRSNGNARDAGGTCRISDVAGGGLSHERGAEARASDAADCDCLLFHHSCCLPGCLLFPAPQTGRIESVARAALTHRERIAANALRSG